MLPWPGASGFGMRVNLRDWRRTGKALFEWLDEAQEADYY
jgi:hypothetical protein